MNPVTTAGSTWDLLTGQRKDIAGVGDASFASIFGTSFKGVSGNRNGIQDMLDRLSQRFPNASVIQGEADAGIKGTEELFGKEEGDKVAVDQSALTGMFGSSEMAKKIEDAIAAFLEGTNTEAMQGAYVQRSISITITTVRVGVFQRSEDNGDMLAGSELKTALHDKLREMIDRFFGKVPAAEETDDKAENAEDGSEETAVEKTDGGKETSGYNFGAMWSMELFYSQTTVAQYTDFTGSGQANRGVAYSATSMMSRFSFVSGSLIPQALSQGAGDSSSGGSGPFTSLLEALGLASDGVSSSGDGFLMRLRESRNLMAELMELYGSRIGRPAAAATEETSATDAPAETEGVEAPQEAPAVE